MKKVLMFSALFLLASVSLSAQVVKGAGLWYFMGWPNVTPSTATGTEVAYSINNKTLAKWNRTTLAWEALVQDSSITNELQDLILSNDTLSLTLSDSIILMAQYRNHVWEIANLSDTTSVTDPIEGDIAYTSTGDTIAFRGATAWLPFTGGGGGGTFNSFNIAGDTGSSIVTDGQTVTVAGGYGINTAESGGTVTVTADTSQIATPYFVRETVSDSLAAIRDSLALHPSGTGTNLRIPVWTGTNSLGSSTLLQSATGQTLDANLAFRITGGTTASRPTGAAGMMYYNTSNNWFDLHNGTSWFNPARSATTNGLFTAGSVLFGGSAGTIQQDNANIFWDDTNNRLGLGTTSPNQQLELTGNIRFPTTSFASQVGVIYKGVDRFIHNFSYGNNGTVTTLGENTFVGIRAGNFTTGATATVSSQASNNTVIGYEALDAVTTGYSNCAFGSAALGANTTGYRNMAIGRNSMLSNLVGFENVAIGDQAMVLNTGNNNTGIGYQAIATTSSGSNNTAIGNIAGRYAANGVTENATSNNSVFIGAATRANASGETNQNVFGYLAIGRGSNTTTLGNSSITSTKAFGTFEAGTLSGTGTQIGGWTAGNVATTLTEGYGINVTSGALEVDTTQVATQSDVAAMQTIFTGGTMADSSIIDMQNFSLNFDNAGGFALSGNTGTIPVSGAGTRMMWVPDKAAFRAGTVSGSEWNSDFIGLNSFVAGGVDNTCVGQGSVIAGGSSNLIDENSPLSTTIASTGTNTIGSGNGLNAILASDGGQIEGDYNLIAGGNNSITGNNNVASGGESNSIVGATYSAIIGGQINTLTGSNAVILGGIDNIAPSYAEFASGTYPTVYTAQDSLAYDPLDRLVTFGNGTSTMNRSNALIIYKGGVGAAKMHVNPGTSTTVPTQTLQIGGDVRVDDITNGNATAIPGYTSGNVLTTTTLGASLDLSSGTLSTAQSFFNDYDASIILTGITSTPDTIDTDSNVKSNDWGFNPTTNTYTYNGTTGRYYSVSVSAQGVDGTGNAEALIIGVYRNNTLTSAVAQGANPSGTAQPFAMHGQAILLLSNGDTINAKVSTTGVTEDFTIENYSLIIKEI